MENKKEKGKKAKLWWVTVLIVLLLGVFFGFGYALGAKKFVNIFNDTVKKEIKNNDNKVAAEETTVEETTETTEQAPTSDSSQNYKTCEGVYTGTGGISQDISGAVTNGEIKLTLSSDGKFSIDRPSMNNVGPDQGNYYVLGNTIFFIKLKDVTGPTDLDPAYAASAAVMRGDCESVYMPNGWFITGEITLTK